MGKVPVRLREVVYTLSPFEQSVMNGLFKDFGSTLYGKGKSIVYDIIPFCVVPLVGTMWYCADYKEKEKLHHRY